LKVNKEIDRDHVEKQVMEQLILENRQLKALIKQKDENLAKSSPISTDL
jgi:NurA-like 5'-3' nuclease